MKKVYLRDEFDYLDGWFSLKSGTPTPFVVDTLSENEQQDLFMTLSLRKDFDTWVQKNLLDSTKNIQLAICD